MSLQAIVWAFDQRVSNPMDKFILVALANYASDRGLTYPDVLTLVWMTEENERTVRRALQRLCARGLLSDTGKRLGKTQRVRVYQLPEEACRRPIESGHKVRIKSGQNPDSIRTQTGLSDRIAGTRARDELGTENNLSLVSLSEPEATEKSFKLRFGAIFNRRPTTKWDADEERAWREVWQPGLTARAAWIKSFDDDLRMVERYYASERNKPKSVCRTILLRLLRHWAGEVDRAISWCEKHPVRSTTKRFMQPRMMVEVRSEVPQPSPEEEESERKFREEFALRRGRPLYDETNVDASAANGSVADEPK